MRRIAIDARSIGKGKHGIAKYVFGILQGLESISAEWSSNFEFFVVINSDTEIKTKLPVILSKSKFLSWHAWYEIPRLLKQNKIDLYFNPSFESFPYLKVPYIQVIHDLNHLYFGNIFQKMYYQALLKPSAKRASKIFTVSEFTQNALSKWLGRQKSTIAILPNTFQVPTSIARRGQQSYFLGIGNTKPHKGLIEIAKNWGNWNTLPLYVTMPENSVRGFRNVTAIGEVNEAKLQEFILGAKALVFPSIYEGFGRPPFEAALLGCPVVCSDIPVLHEALRNFDGSGIYFVKSTDMLAWKKTMEDLSSKESIPSPNLISNPPTTVDVAKLLLASLKIH